MRPDGRLIKKQGQPQTPRKSFRIPEQLYQEAQDAARYRREYLADVVRRCLEQYVRDTSIG